MKTRKQPKRWLKISVTSELDHASLAAMVEAFEATFKVKHLYYALYDTFESRWIEISALTEATFPMLRRCLMIKGVTGVKMEIRGTASLAHAYAYQAVKRLKAYAEDNAQDEQLADVIHWMCNMRGHDYLREARFYSYRALVVTHNVVVKSTEFKKQMAAKKETDGRRK